jgi:protein-tyrosine-phosphatase
MPNVKRVLFLCTGNSARSQMAEALLRHLGEGRFEAFSAGTSPRAAVHPQAIDTLRRNHISSAGLVPKDLSKLSALRFDFVITVCDRAREQCPIIPGADMIHWSFPDPAEETDETKQARAFQDVLVGLDTRIRLFVAAIAK